MVSPLDSLRPAGAPAAPSSGPRPAVDPGAFEAALKQATQQVATPAETVARPAAFDVDPLEALNQAALSMQRASQHISSARAYFRGSGAPPRTPPVNPGLDLRG